MQYCKVNKCRFSSFHTTSGHKCTTCNTFGHGSIECGSVKDIKNLEKYMKDIIPVNYQCTRSKCLYKTIHTTDGHFCHMCNMKHSVHNCSKNPQYIKRKEIELNTKINSYTIKCPKCREVNEYNDMNITSDIQSLECIVCFESEKKMIFFPQCKHICCCNECASNMRESNDVLPPLNTYDEINDYAQKKFCKIPNKIYITINIGMGCQYIVKRDDIGCLSEIWFDHCDDHMDVVRMKIMEDFIVGYTNVTL